MAPGDDASSDTGRMIKAAKARIEFEEDPHRAAIEDNPETVTVTWKTWAAVVFMAMSLGPPIGLSFMCIAAVIVPVTAELGDMNLLPWVVGSWSLTTACVFSLAGPLSDIFGRRNPILLGDILTIVGFIVGATAKSAPALIAAEGIVGLGTGLIFVAFAGVPEMLPNKWRSVGCGMLEGGIAIPWGIVSTLIATSLQQNASWRWIFYIAIIVQVFVTIGTATFYWPMTRPRGDYDKTVWDQIRGIDPVGLFLIMAGVATFLIGLTWGGTAGHDWKSASVIAPIVVGFFGCACGFAYEWNINKAPLFPFKLFAMIKEFTILLVLVFVSGMNFYAMAPLLPQGSLYMFTTDGIQIGIIALPNTLMVAVAGVVLPVFAHRVGYVKWQVVLAMALQTIFLGASAGAVYPNNKAAWMAIPAIGVPMFLWVVIVGYAIASLHVPHSMLGVAMGLLGTFRSTGGAVGNAIFATILQRKFASYVGGEIGPVMERYNLDPSLTFNVTQGAIAYNIGIPGSLDNIPEVTDTIKDALQVAVRSAWGHAFKIVFLCTIPFSVVALILSFWITDPTKYMTNHVQFAMDAEREMLSKVQQGKEESHHSGETAEVIEVGGGEAHEKSSA